MQIGQVMVMTQAQEMVVCTRCNTAKQQVLDPDQQEILHAKNGLVSLPCERCHRDTLWTLNKNVERRRLRRHEAELPVRVRTDDGATEIARTANLSRNGFYFYSAIPYEEGQPVKVVLNWSEDSQPLEQPAKVVRVTKFSWSAKRGVAILLDSE